MTLLLAAPTAAAGATPKAREAGADVVLSYDPPQISEDGSHVTWHWNLRNRGTETAYNVTLVHRLNPPLAGVKASAPCEVTPRNIRCHYPEVPAGGKEHGTVDADLPPDLSGTVQINGRVTWRQDATAP